MQMLLDLMEERQKWIDKRDGAIREISRLSDLIRATMNMIPADQLARYEPIFERLENRPAGLSMAIRACFTAGTLGLNQAKADEGETWFTPVEIRDALKRMGFPFENYKANPLASIHTTLKRMVPAELETSTLKDGQKVYRLKSAGEWTQALGEIRQWLQSSYSVVGSAGSVIAVRRNKKDPEKEAAAQPKPEGEKRGTSGGA